MKRKVWNSLIILLLTTLSFSTISCIPHLRGNGKVVKVERNISNFKAIEVSNGIDLSITQDSFEKVVVETDENIQKILKTEVEGEMLKIYLEEGVLHAKKLNVYVTLKQLKALDTSSGADAKSTGKINAEDLKINSSSGSEAKMEVSCQHLTARSSSGSNIKLSGTAQYLTADSSSGSEINGSSLVAEKADLSASSGADIDVQVTRELKAHASSGAGINVSGSPSVKETNSSSGGSVHIR
jgi:hypothetical protein